MWSPELIPDEDDLLMRIHRNHLRDGALTFAAFRDRGTDPPGMSTNWEKYATPEETRLQARSPEANGVVAMNAGGVRAIQGLRVEHSPLPDNRAHTDVLGEKTTEARMKLRRLCRWKLEAAPDS